MSGDHMVTKRLTKRVVESLAPGSDRYVVWDSELKGFGVRVTPQGRKTYLVRYRTTGGADRRLTLTTHGVMTTEEAREQARLALADAAMGGDPQGAKAERRAEMTMKELCALYMAEGTATKKETTLRIDRIRIDRHINPRLGNRKVTDITRGDIQRLMIDVGNGHIRGEATPHTRGGKGAAARAVGLLGGIFTFAQERGFVEANPVRGLKRYKDNRRERLLSAAELGKLGDVLSGQEKDGSDPRHVAIIRLLLLTGARKNEIARLRWSEVDLEKGLLRLKDSKTGPKVIRLGIAAASLLARLPKAHATWVFPDRKHADRPTSNLDWAWVRIHDLRHSFASMGVAGVKGWC
jgi:integrase